jgi:hypothetical protein
MRRIVSTVRLILGLAPFAAAAPVPGQGPWETKLQARDIGGNPVALDAAGAVFFYYDTALNITWLRNWNASAGSSFDNGSSTTDGRMNHPGFRGDLFA